MCFWAAWPLCQASLHGVLIFARCPHGLDPLFFCSFHARLFKVLQFSHLLREALPDRHKIHSLSFPRQLIHLLFASSLALPQSVIVYWFTWSWSGLFVLQDCWLCVGGVPSALCSLCLALQVPDEGVNANS